MTLNDLERRNGHYFALFQRIRVASGAHCVKVHVRYLIFWWVLVIISWYVLCRSVVFCIVNRSFRGWHRPVPLSTSCYSTHFFNSLKIVNIARDCAEELTVKRCLLDARLKRNAAAVVAAAAAVAMVTSNCASITYQCSLWVELLADL